MAKKGKGIIQAPSYCNNLSQNICHWCTIGTLQTLSLCEIGGVILVLHMNPQTEIKPAGFLKLGGLEPPALLLCPPLYPALRMLCISVLNKLHPGVLKELAYVITGKSPRNQCIKMGNAQDVKRWELPDSGSYRLASFILLPGKILESQLFTLTGCM